MFTRQGNKNFCCPKKYFKYAWERLEKVASNEKYSEAMDSEVRNILFGYIERELKKQNKIELTDFSSDYV